MLTEEGRMGFRWMQARMIQLLLRHDLPVFDKQFAEHQAPQLEADDALKPYRDVAVLLYLRRECFAEIIPQIKRRLSFRAPEHQQREPLPARGRTDWPRTIAHQLRELPDQLPLTVDIRQRRRDFATPENLLVVITLLEYREAAQAALATEALADPASALRHPLQEIVADCTRELAFLQFAGLVRQCDAIRAGRADVSVAAIEERVAQRLIPGGTSAYQHLLRWRARLAALQLLDARPDEQEVQMLGADPQQADILYQRWVFYELLDHLARTNSLIEWSPQQARAAFCWGTPVRMYELIHDRKIRTQATTAGAAIPEWQHAPESRPDLFIRAQDAAVVAQAGQVIWRAPGYMLDAKFYQGHQGRKAPRDAVKRMIADLHLTGQRHGALVFAFQKTAPTARRDADSDEDLLPPPAASDPSGLLYCVNPDPARGNHTTPDVAIGIWQVAPVATAHAEAPANPALLSALLDTVHHALSPAIPVRCHGLFLDELGTTAHGALANTALMSFRDGAVASESREDLLVCPKPHVGAWRVDLVSLKHDCCTSRRCHIIGQPGVRKPTRISALEDIGTILRDAATRDTAEDDELTLSEALTAHIRQIAQRYADLVSPDLSRFEKEVRNDIDIGEGFDTNPLLDEHLRKTLVLAQFLAAQIRAVNAQNYAGPTILFCGVVESLCKTTLKAALKKQNLMFVQENGKYLNQTLGSYGRALDHGEVNFQKMRAACDASNHWPDPPAEAGGITLRRWVGRVNKIYDIRNIAAHQARASAADYATLHNNLFGSSGTGRGIINGLIVSWRTP